MREVPFDAKCHARHMGLYAIEPGYLNAAVSSIKAGAWPQAGPAAAVDDAGRELYRLSSDGIAVISIAGPMMKGYSKFAHANTLRLRQAVRAAVRDQKVEAIVLHIDSPGGMVAGTQELADDIREAAQRKRVVAHIDDLGASAAYYVASQAQEISLNQAGRVGSIGVFAVVHDESKSAEAEGVEVHVLSTGAFKGAFVPGAPVPEEHLQELQGEIDDAFSLFIASVERGRGEKGLVGAALRDVADGRTFAAKEARRLHLVDRVASLDTVMDDLAAELAKKRSERRERDHKLKRYR